MYLKFIVFAIAVVAVTGQQTLNAETVSVNSTSISRYSTVPDLNLKPTDVKAANLNDDEKQNSVTVVPDTTTVDAAKEAAHDVQPVADENHTLPSPNITNSTTTTSTPNNTTTTTNTTITPLSTTTLSTSTPAPTTTTQLQPKHTTLPAVPTTTVKPVPEPGDWTVKSDGNVCIVAHMELQFNLTSKSKNILLTVPKNATASGLCSDSVQNLKLEWDNNTFEIMFDVNSTTNRFLISELNLTVDTKELDTSKSEMFLSFTKVDPEFPATPIKMSYKCDKKQNQTLKSNDSEWSAELLISHVQLEAFRKASDAKFAAAKDCEAYDTPDIVPTIVGTVLSLLVLIVLVLYLVGRRRFQNKGYLSM